MQTPLDAEQQAFRKYGIERHRDEMRQRRETIRSAPDIFLDRSGTGLGKSYADAIEISFYKRSLAAVPRPEIAWEALESYKKTGINAAV